MTLNGAMALLRYFTQFTYNVVLKQLLGLSPFQNLLLIVYDHISYDLRDYSAIIWAKQQEAIASTWLCSCLCPWVSCSNERVHLWCEVVWSRTQPYHSTFGNVPAPLHASSQIHQYSCNFKKHKLDFSCLTINITAPWFFF